MNALVATIVALFCCAGCATSRPVATPSPEAVTVDLTGGHCTLQDEIDAPGFATFICVTDDAVDAPHIARGERHGIVVIVHVPFNEARVFMRGHPPVRPQRPSTPSTPGTMT